MTNTDIGALYGAARQRIAALVTTEGVDLETIVPATPAWRARDVVAHVAGVAADATSGNMAGAPGEAWTEAQVARGRDRSLDEILADWERSGPMLEGFLSSPSGAPASAVVVDVHTHEADIRHAFGMPIALPDEFLAWAIDGLRDGFYKAVAEAGLLPVTMQASDAEWFRARLGRRTEAQVRAYDWSADPTPYLETFFIFGPTEQASGERL